MNNEVAKKNHGDTEGTNEQDEIFPLIPLIFTDKFMIVFQSAFICGICRKQNRQPANFKL
jgi:hypothetical protein